MESKSDLFKLLNDILVICRDIREVVHAAMEEEDVDSGGSQDEECALAYFDPGEDIKDDTSRSNVSKAFIPPRKR